MSLSVSVFGSVYLPVSVCRRVSISVCMPVSVCLSGCLSVCLCAQGIGDSYFNTAETWSYLLKSTVVTLNRTPFSQRIIKSR